MLVETNEKELIWWIGSIEKLEGGFLGFAEFVGHAAAEIQDDADGNRHIFRGEIHNFLLSTEKPPGSEIPVRRNSFRRKFIGG